jgi:putative nucleotidyltransferase with HDIG domain
MQAIKDSTQLRIDRNFEMPSVPVVLCKILQSVDDNRASARRLEELILHDLSLSIRILKLANSAFYSFRSEVKTISHAIALLGLNLVRSLAIGVSIFESFTKGLREEATYVSQLWMHSFAVGLIAQEVWVKRSNRAEGEFALLCGLLHDLGKVIYFKKDGVRYSQLFAMEKGDDDPGIRDLELKIYEVDHASLGALLAKQWNLPPDLATIIRLHHDDDAGGIPLVAAVSLADMLVKQAGIGYDGDHKSAANLPGLQELLKMDQGELDALKLLTERKRADVEEFFKLTA